MESYLDGATTCPRAPDENVCGRRESPPRRPLETETDAGGTPCVEGERDPICPPKRELVSGMQSYMGVAITLSKAGEENDCECWVHGAHQGTPFRHCSAIRSRARSC